MTETTVIIALHRAAPAKPARGQACNGCGVCCAAEPCPVAMLMLWQRRGRCKALRWQEQTARYVCGLAASPAEYLLWLPDALGGWAGRRFARRIAAGLGCDADLEVASGPA